MSTRIEYLTGDDRERIKTRCLSMFLKNDSYEFAVALHQGLGLSLAALMNGDKICHAFVVEADTTLRDVRGNSSSTEIDFGEPFGINPPYTIKVICEIDLDRPLCEHKVNLARAYAEALWPHLKWETKHQNRFNNFADRLAQLSKETGIWVSNPSLFSTTILVDKDTEDEGDHLGYTLSQTIDGLGFAISIYP